MIKRIYHHYKNIKRIKRISSKAVEIRKKILNELEHNYNHKKSVFILQYSFFTLDGKSFFAGGAERYILDLKKIINGIGYQTILFQYGDFFWSNEIDGLKIFGLPRVFLDNFSLLYCPAFPKPELTILSGFLNADLGMQEIDIVISHGVIWDNPDNNFKWNEFMSINLRKINHLVSVDTNTISWFRTTYPAASVKKNFEYIPNYVNLDEFTQADNKSDRVKILFPRRLEKARGYWLASEAAKYLLTRYQCIDFSFVGHIHSQEIQDDINMLCNEFPGRVDHKTVAPEKMKYEYQNADIVIIPTLYSEGTSLSCIEAMATGNAIISTNVGGLSNLIIDRYNGLLINPDSSSLIEALVALVENKSLCEELSVKSLDVAKSFDKKLWDQRWLKVLNRYLTMEISC